MSDTVKVVGSALAWLEGKETTTCINPWLEFGHVGYVRRN